MVYLFILVLLISNLEFLFLLFFDTSYVGKSQKSIPPSKVGIFFIDIQ